MWFPWLICGGIVLVMSYFLPYAFRIVQQRWLRSLCTRRRVLVLTFDDGPSQTTTPLLLDLLANQGMKATFFLLGYNVSRAAGVVERIQNDGHEMACHSHSHVHAWKAAPWRTWNDLNRGFETLEAHGIHAKLYRPPYGKLNLLTWLNVVFRGVRIGWWTIASGDTRAKLPDPKSIVRTVEENDGGVVLMHDFERTEECQTFLLELTRQLLESARRHRWTICTLGELLQTESDYQQSASVIRGALPATTTECGTANGSN